jgi:RND family efflux transporter MFP subunit
MTRPCPGTLVSLIPLFALLVFGGVGACGPSADAAGEGSAAAPPATPAAEATLIETVVLGTMPFQETIELVGETEPVRSAMLSAEIPGRIVRLDLTEGQDVRAGAIALRVDTTTQTASIGPLQAQIAQVEADLERNRRLLERGLGTAAVVEQLENQLVVLQANITQIRSGVRQGTTAVPISGVVTDVYAEPGEYAGPGAPVARIIDVSRIRVRVGLPERDIAHVEQGMTVDVRIEATGTRVQGTLTRIGLEANLSNRTFPLEITVDNADQVLRAGLRARVSIPRQQRDSALVIPRDAVLQGLVSPEAMVLNEGQVEVRALTLGPGRGGFVVVEEGLRPGDLLVVRGHRGLVPGEAVRDSPQGPCCQAQFDRFVRGADPAARPADPADP